MYIISYHKLYLMFSIFIKANLDNLQISYYFPWNAKNEDYYFHFNHNNIWYRKRLFDYG